MNLLSESLQNEPMPYLDPHLRLGREVVKHFPRAHHFGWKCPLDEMPVFWAIFLSVGVGVWVERFFVSGWCSVVLEVLVSKMSLPISWSSESGTGARGMLWYVGNLCSQIKIYNCISADGLTIVFRVPTPKLACTVHVCIHHICICSLHKSQSTGPFQAINS